MALPSKLERLISKIATPSEMEAGLLEAHVKRLTSNLDTLRRLVGSQGPDSYERLVKCALGERSAGCFDQFEEALEQQLTQALRRDLTDQEEVLVSLLLDQITAATEALVILGGIELIEEEEEPDDEQSP